MGIISDLLVPLAPAKEQLAVQSTPVLIFGAIAAFCLIATIVNVLQQLLFADPNTPPAVFHLFPFFGSTITYGIDPPKFFLACQEKYGDTFTFILLGRKMTVCLGPKGNDFIFNGKLSQLCAEEAYTHLTTPVFGTDVVYDCPNSKLMDQKRFMKFGLTSETFKTYVPLIVEEFENLLRGHPLLRTDTGSVDLLDFIPVLTVFTATRTLQGKEIRQGFTGEIAKLYHDLDMGFTPLNFLFPWFPFPQNRRRDAAQRKMAQSYMDIINRRRAAEARGDLAHEKDMIWNLMRQTYRDGKAVPDKEVAHMMIALLMAGQHTSMATMTWILQHLASRPDVIQDLYEEQQRVFGKDLGPLTYESLSELKIHNYVIKETLRLHPPLHSIMRKVKSPMHVPNTPWTIPNTHYLMAAPGVSAIDVNYFKDPMEYDPYRWATEKDVPVEEEETLDFGYGLVTKGTSSPYLPFGAGRHRCIGEQFANVQLGTLTAMFVRSFKLGLPSGRTKPVPPDYTSLIAMPQRPSTVTYEWRKPAMK